MRVFNQNVSVGLFVFSNPSSGNIFFGEPNSDLTAPVSGFMYEAATASLRSKDDNVVIDSMGGFVAKNAVIKGDSEFQGSFDCDVIKTYYEQESTTVDYAPENVSTQARDIAYHYDGGKPPSGYTTIPIRVDKIPEAAYLKYYYSYTSAWGMSSESFVISFLDKYKNELRRADYPEILFSGEISTDTTVFASTGYQNGNVSSYQYMNDISFITVTGGNVLLVDVKSNPTDAELESMQVGEIYVESGSLRIKQ